jgi:hypothetical protein
MTKRTSTPRSADAVDTRSPAGTGPDATRPDTPTAPDAARAGPGRTVDVHDDLDPLDEFERRDSDSDGVGDDDAADDGLVEHPDGWYWTAADGRQQFGPFGSADRARADRDGISVDAVTGDEMLDDVERETGMAEFSVDPVTGRPYDDEDGPIGEDTPP